MTSIGSRTKGRSEISDTAATLDNGRTVPVLFTVAVFVAAALLFVVQPMVGKMMLPRAGGAPQVWNTSLLFFQATLLAGYLYAHVSVKWLGVQRQALLHLAVLALPLLVLPVALPDTYPPDGARLSPWVLGVLTVAVGAPRIWHTYRRRGGAHSSGHPSHARGPTTSPTFCRCRRGIEASDRRASGEWRECVQSRGHCIRITSRAAT